MQRIHEYKEGLRGVCEVQVPDSLMSYETTVACGHTKDEHEPIKKKAREEDVDATIFRTGCAVGMSGEDREKWCCGAPSMCGDF